VALTIAGRTAESSCLSDCTEKADHQDLSIWGRLARAARALRSAWSWAVAYCCTWSGADVFPGRSDPGTPVRNKPNPTRVPIEAKESIRWLENLRQSTALFEDADRCVHIGDRESDIYELFCEAQTLGTHFIIRACVDRMAGDGHHTIADE
jgi:hypothetical protein